jgi:hypothetical protein
MRVGYEEEKYPFFRPQRAGACCKPVPNPGESTLELRERTNTKLRIKKYK